MAVIVEVFPIISKPVDRRRVGGGSDLARLFAESVERVFLRVEGDGGEPEESGDEAEERRDHGNEKATVTGKRLTRERRRDYPKFKRPPPR
jgi:hypothetical protein